MKKSLISIFVVLVSAFMGIGQDRALAGECKRFGPYYLGGRSMGSRSFENELIQRGKHRGNDAVYPRNMETRRAGVTRNRHRQWRFHNFFDRRQYSGRSQGRYSFNEAQPGRGSYQPHYPGRLEVRSPSDRFAARGARKAENRPSFVPGLDGLSSIGKDFRIQTLVNPDPAQGMAAPVPVDTVKDKYDRMSKRELRREIEHLKGSKLNAHYDRMSKRELINEVHVLRGER